MNRSQRIWLNDADSDKHLRVKLEQNVDTLEVMTLKINTKEAYQNFNADYGVVVGRVRANNGAVIPNAKISIFIPLDEEDENDGRIVSIYPYKKPTDVNNNNKRYNLLPRVSQFDPGRGVYTPNQPFGSFPTKEEILTNPTHFKIYKKYYKYTTTTNEYGDYMIFGAPTGTQTVHMSVDITDIGNKSMTPAAMVNDLGYSENLFTEKNTRIKGSSDLTDIPNIETQEISVDVIPFWGDSQNFDIGITKVDFKTKATISNVFYIFGSSFVDGYKSRWGSDNDNIENLYEADTEDGNNNEAIGIYSKRTANVRERIYYFPNTITDEQINSSDFNPTENVRALDRSQYTALKRDGDFIYIVNCNRRKVTIDELGREVEVNDNEDGIYTEFRGYLTIQYLTQTPELNTTGSVVDPFRVRFKFPQYGDSGNYFEPPDEDTGNETNNTINWKKQHKIFKAGKYYTISKFHGTVGMEKDNEPDRDLSNYGFFNGEEEGQYGFTTITNSGSWVNNLYNRKRDNHVGLIVTQSYYDDNDNFHPNAEYEFPNNTIVKDSNDNTYRAFGANWLNLTIHFPQLGYLRNNQYSLSGVRVPDYFQHQKLNGLNYHKYYNGYYLPTNTQDNEQTFSTDLIYNNTPNYGRNDLHWTDIIEIPKGDILKMSEIGQKGFTDNDINNLTGNNYRNGTNIPSDWGLDKPCPYDGGKKRANPDNSTDPKTYFYKGHGDSDCIQFLIDSGVL